MSSQSSSPTASPSRSTSPTEEQSPSPTLPMETSNSHPRETESEDASVPTPVSHSAPLPRLPDIISHSSRFAAIQERLKAALRVPAQSGFTDTESAEDGALSPCTSPNVDSEMIHVIYEGLPPSPAPSDDSESVSGGWSSSDSDADSDTTQVQSSSRSITPLVTGVGLGLRLLFAAPGSSLPRSSTTAAAGLRSFGNASQRSFEKRPSMARILGYDPGQHRERPSAVLPTCKPIYDNRRSRYAGLGHGLPSHMRQCQRVFSSISVRTGNSRVASSVRTITQALYAEMTRGSTSSWDRGTVRTRDSHSPRPRAPELQLDLDETPTLKRTWAAISRVVVRDSRPGGVAYIPARASGTAGGALSRFVEVGI